MKLGISAIQYVNDVKNGNITCEEFLSKTLEHIEKVDQRLHAYLSLNDDAIEHARAIDKKIKSNEKVGKCYGFPISIKDNICVKGTKTTCGSKVLEEFCCTI